MASTTCWKCLARYSTSYRSTQYLKSVQSLFPHSQRIAAFTTSTTLNASPLLKKQKGSTQSAPRRGEKTTFTVKKKKRPERTSKPPAIGERKAMRKRIILSNTNAIEVRDMIDMNAKSMVMEELRGKVLGIPGPVVDQLRAAQAFKTTQGWGLFRRPGMLIRQETLEYGKIFQSLSKDEKPKTVRRIFVGENSSGKSMLILQAMTMAFLQKWIVINIPEAMDLTIGHTDYSPLPGTTPPTYIQKTYLSTFLSAIMRANPILATMSLSRPPPESFPIPLQSNISLSRLSDLGAQDSEIAWPVFQLLWAELTEPSTEKHERPPIFMALDGLGFAMKQSEYRSASFQLIHAHDLALINWFTQYLSGTSSLPNGGMIVAATSESTNRDPLTLRFCLSQLEAEKSTLDDASAIPSPIAPFLRSTGQSPSLYHQLESFAKHDPHVLDVFSNARGNNIQVHRLKGLSKDEARGLMEYWAKSGILRQTVSESLVGEKWSLSGGGVVGELERGCVKMRV